MNAIQVLKKDHDEIKEFFSQFEEAGERAYKKKQTIAEKVIKELKTHSQLEERIFYPAVQEKAGKEPAKLVLEGIEEHRIADFMMARIQDTDAKDETFDAKFKALSEAVKHHLKEEEGQLFSQVKKVMGEDLDRLGEQMEALERQLEG